MKARKKTLQRVDGLCHGHFSCLANWKIVSVLPSYKISSTGGPCAARSLLLLSIWKSIILQYVVYDLGLMLSTSEFRVNTSGVFAVSPPSAGLALLTPSSTPYPSELQSVVLIMFPSARLRSTLHSARSCFDECLMAREFFRTWYCSTALLVTNVFLRGTRNTDLSLSSSA